MDEMRKPIPDTERTNVETYLIKVYTKIPGTNTKWAQEYTAEFDSLRAPEQIVDAVKEIVEEVPAPGNGGASNEVQ